MLGSKLDSDDISILQKALANPSDMHIQKLLERTVQSPDKESILSSEKLKMDLKNPNSPTLKYFQNIIRNFLIHEEQVRIKATLEHTIQEQKHAQADFAFLEEKAEKAAEARGSLVVADERALQVAQFEKELKEVKESASLASSKVNELSEWSNVFKDPGNLDLAQQLIEARYEKIAENKEMLKVLEDSSKLMNSSNFKEFEEIKKNYQRHLELSTSETLKKHTKQYKDNDVSALQVLHKAGTLEELQGKFIKKALENSQPSNQSSGAESTNSQPSSAPSRAEPTNSQPPSASSNTKPTTPESSEPENAESFVVESSKQSNGSRPAWTEYQAPIPLNPKNVEDNESEGSEPSPT
jgi:hypothetical protein